MKNVSIQSFRLKIRWGRRVLSRWTLETGEAVEVFDLLIVSKNLHESIKFLLSLQLRSRTSNSESEPITTTLFDATAQFKIK